MNAGNADEAEACSLHMSRSAEVWARDSETFCSVSRAEISCSVYSGTHSDVFATLRDLQQTTAAKNNPSEASPQSLKNFTDVLFDPVEVLTQKLTVQLQEERLWSRAWL